MRGTHRSLLSFALALALASPLSVARADEPETVGALVGGSYCLFGVDLGLHSGEAALAEGAPRADVEGLYGMVRVTAGALLRVTRFGSEAGLEGTFGLGWIDGAAFGGREEARLSADIAAGVVVVPYRSALVGGSSFKLAAGFGSDHDVDYLYASGRMGFGETSGDFGLELAYTYRVGDAPTGATLTEHRAAAQVRMGGFTVGVAGLFGESARYQGVAPAPPAPTDRAELFQEGTMRKGEYTDWQVTLGYAWR